MSIYFMGTSEREGAMRPVKRVLLGSAAGIYTVAGVQAADLPLCARLHANQARAIAEGRAEAAARASDKLLDYVENFTRGTVAV